MEKLRKSQVDPDILYMLENNEELMCGIETIYRIQMWNFLAHYEKPDKGFLLDTNKNVLTIFKEIDRDFPGHSGCSMAWTVNFLSIIAKQHQPLLHYLRRRNYMLVSDGLLTRLPRDMVINIGKFL